MRRILLIAAISASLVLAACSSDSSPEPTTSTSGSPTAAPTPSATASMPASPSAAPSATVAGPTIDIPATITGMHVAGVQDGAWPDSNVPFGALRLWDSGTQWSAIEAVKGTYNWALLDRAVANAESHNVKDILLVLGSTPTWNAKRVTAGDYPVPGAASPPKSVRPGTRSFEPLPSATRAASRPTRCGTRPASRCSGTAPLAHGRPHKASVRHHPRGRSQGHGGGREHDRQA